MKPAFVIALVAVFIMVVSSGCISQNNQGTPLPPDSDQNIPNQTPESPIVPGFIPVSEKPDLAVVSASYSPLLPRINEDITFTAVVANLGGETAQLRRYKILPLTSAKAIEPVRAERDILAPGETTEMTAVWKIYPAGIAPVIIGIDAFDEIEEFNETNNNLNLKIRMQPSIGFAGCSSLKTAVCSIVLDVDPEYFEKHPECAKVECTPSSPLLACDEACPHPRG